MEKIKVILIIVSIFLVIALGILFQIGLDSQREKVRIEQEIILQEKYDEGFNAGITKQFTDDEKVQMGKDSIITSIIEALNKDKEVRINTPDGLRVLIEKVIE